MTSVYAYITNVGDGTISIVDTATNTVVAALTVGSGSQGIAISPDGNTAYVTNTNDGTVSVIDLTVSPPVVKTGTGYPLTVGTNPYGVAVTPDGKKAYVVNSGPGTGVQTVSVIDLTVSPPVVKTGTGYPITVGQSPFGIAITPDGAHVYVANNLSDSVSVIATATDTVSTTISLPAGSDPFGVAVTPDGNHVYVTDKGTSKVSVIATATNTVSATITLSANSFPQGIAITPNGNTAYVTGQGSGNKVSVIDTATNTVSTTITVGVGSAGVSITSDGKYAYVANESSNNVSVIDTSTNTVTDTISVGNGPVAFGNFIQASSSSITQGDFMNKFRNGTMDIWQHGTASTSVSTSGAYVADGWIVAPTGANCTAQQTTSNTRTGALSTYSLLMTGATSVTDILVKQRIESYIAQQLEGQQVTVQAQVYNNTGASITPTITVKHAGSVDNWSSPTTDVNAVSLQACANGAWTQVAYTFAASSSSGKGLEITFDFGNNFSTTGKSVQITELDIRSTPGVATGLNSSPPVAEMRPIEVELALCQRYLCKTFLQGTAPAQAAGLSTGEIFLISVNAAANSNYFLWLFPVTMRTTPTVTTYNPVSSNANWRDTTANADVTVNSLGNYDNKAGFFAQAAVTLGNNLRIHALATAEL